MNSLYRKNFTKTADQCNFLYQPRKYILQPIFSSNPYQNHPKSQSPNPYTLIDPQNESQYFQNLIDQPALKIYCETCKKEITHQCHIQFTTNQLCIGCFSHKQQSPQQYKIVQKIDFPIFQPTWSAYHQVLLLKGIQKWGFGNWSQIRQYMEYFGAKFTEDQLESHYHTFYLHDETFEPRFSQVLIDKKRQYKKCQSNSGQNPVSMVSLTTHLPQDEINFRFEQIDDFSHEAILQQLPNHLLTPAEEKTPGYNSKRKQFETDFDQTAQKILANLQFRDDDLPQERQVKYKMIENYNKRLKKRYQVQDFIIEHQLMDKQFQKQLDDGRTDYEKQAASQLKSFMRFSSFQQHNQLVRRLAMQRQLKSIIEGLRSFRKSSNSGRLKQVMENLKKQSTSPQNYYSREKPRKIIHIDNCQGSRQQDNKNQSNEDELVKRMKINMNDLKHIIKQSSVKQSGQAFVYKGVEVKVVQKK